METIFDHNVTKEELKMLFWSDKITLETFEKAGITERGHNEALYSLYLIRGDKKMAKKFLDRIPDDIKKVYETMNHDFAS